MCIHFYAFGKYFCVWKKSNYIFMIWSLSWSKKPKEKVRCCKYPANIIKYLVSMRTTSTWRDEIFFYAKNCGLYQCHMYFDVHMNTEYALLTHKKYDYFEVSRWICTFIYVDIKIIADLLTLFACLLEAEFERTHDAVKRHKTN